MPISINPEKFSGQKEIELGDLVQYLIDNKIDCCDESSLIEAAPMLNGLSKNKKFLIKDMVSSIKDMYNIQSSNVYTPQVHMLWSAPQNKTQFSIRACFWPSIQDDILRSTGTEPFFYHQPHDHNFNFLTVGYHGPGYGSNYYEYDYSKYQGVCGEKIDLEYKETSSLSEGKILLYRAFTDIHDQLPPDKFSVSINILESSARSQSTDQYFFDIGNSTITKEANSYAPTSIISAFCALSDDDGRKLILDMAMKHKHERFKITAWSALIDNSKCTNDIENIISLASNFTSGKISSWVSNQRRLHGI